MNKHTSEKDNAAANKPESLTCGIIMPISAIDGCTADHWSEVKNIVTESVEAIPTLKFSVKVVSEADDVGVIQKRIVQNLYNSDMVVCDVSGKNPNVMFELGMRLAFDKPTIIIKDDKTDYSFDTAIIEHVPYPRDLRFTKIVTFKSLLGEKIIGTYKAAKSSQDHSTFLKNFGKFQVANLTQDVVPADKLVFEMLAEMQGDLSRLRRELPRTRDTIVRRIRQEDGDAIEGTARIYRALNDYLAENPNANLDEMISDEVFEQRMIQKSARQWRDKPCVRPS